MKTETHKCAVMGPGPRGVSLASDRNWSTWHPRMVEKQKQHGWSAHRRKACCSWEYKVICRKHGHFMLTTYIWSMRSRKALRNGARHSQMMGVSVSSLEACLWLWGIMGIFCVKKGRGTNNQVNTYVERIGNDLLFFFFWCAGIVCWRLALAKCVLCA